MREEIKTCTDSDICTTELFALDNTIVSIVHIPGAHIIHTSSDYDSDGQLKEKICDELADIGVFHPHTKMNDIKSNRLKDRAEFIRKGLKIK